MQKALESYYGELTKDVKKFLVKYCKDFNDEQVGAFKSALYKEHEAKTCPTLDTMKKVYEIVTGKKPKEQIKITWNICRICGAKYYSGFMLCPKCYVEGRGIHEDFETTGGEKLPDDVLNWNTTYLPMQNGDPDCFHCQRAWKEKTFCKQFGDYLNMCSMEKQEKCGCYDCCTKARNANKDFDRKYPQGGNSPYFKPGKKIDKEL